jgi:hypothetical protein
MDDEIIVVSLRGRFVQYVEGEQFVAVGMLDEIVKS